MSFQLSLRREILTLPRENTARSSSSRLSPLSALRDFPSSRSSCAFPTHHPTAGPRVPPPPSRRDLFSNPHRGARPSFYPLLAREKEETITCALLNK